jgi:alkylhydroperoxidase family enzyme
METPFLAPIEKPKSHLWKLIYFMARKRFGKVITPLKVSAVRMPIAFGSFSGKISKLDKKLQLPAETMMLICEQVAHINVCKFCMDIGRAMTIVSSMNQRKFDELPDYQSSLLFSEKERVLLDFVTMLSKERKMDHEQFEKM